MGRPVIEEGLFKRKKAMNRRETLEDEIVKVQRVINTAPPDTPDSVRKGWHQVLTSLRLELNNLEDGDEDNNL